MILVDMSVWADHLRTGDPVLVDLLVRERVVIHRYVIGELALGQLRGRATILGSLKSLPLITEAIPDEVLDFIERHQLAGSGIGYVDAHLLAAVRLAPGSALWTRDERLRAAADRLGIGASAVQ